VIAAQLLAVSIDMPALAAIELVLIALPWTLLLKAPVLGQAELLFMALIVSAESSSILYCTISQNMSLNGDGRPR
jgi:hypothetical protein